MTAVPIAQLDVSRDSAIETLRRCVQALATDLTPADRARITALHEQALRVLQGPRHRPETLNLARRLAALEHQLADLEPVDRMRIVRDRFGISRRRVYELREINQCGNISALSGD